MAAQAAAVVHQFLQLNDADAAAPAPAAAQTALLVDLKQQQLQGPSSWVSRYVTQPNKVAWLDRVREFILTVVGAVVADCIMRNAHQILER